MTNEEVIAKLVKENLELKEQRSKMTNVAEEINSMVCCIGGPLNDNALKYNNKQLLIFWKIHKLVEEII